jgi:hypothetical protein
MVPWEQKATTPDRRLVAMPSALPALLERIDKIALPKAS